MYVLTGSQTSSRSAPANEMSTRQLRKLQQQRELELAKSRAQDEAQEEDEESDEEVDIPRSAAAKPSLFASLAALEDGDDDDEEPEEEVIADESEEEPEVEPTAVSETRKSKKSKKKKKKAKQAEPKAAEQVSVTSELDGGPDEIDLALRELNLMAMDGTSSSEVKEEVTPEFQRICSLLSVNSQHLKVANEMRNLFGKTAVGDFDDPDGATPRGGRRRQRAAQRQVDLETALKGHHKPGKGLPELTLRRNIFIQGKDDWPRATTGGLKMELVEHSTAFDSTTEAEFRFTHDDAYETVQKQFNALVEMGDPQNLIGLLQRNPYNISLLLQVSKVAKDQGDHALSSDLIERALFTFGRATISQFGNMLAEGKARLDFARPENRELWLAGYHYIKSLVMKGTYRTALEWAKLLLAMDPRRDPYRMDLMIHHLGLRAFESQYVLYQYTLAHITVRPPSLALAAMQLKDGKQARAILRDSIQQMPWLWCRLFQEINLGTPPPSIWGALPNTSAEKLYSEIWIRQTKDLWNTPEATSLLVEVAQTTDKVDQGKPLFTDDDITLALARFVYLDNTPAVMALVPSKLLHRAPNSDSDPLPPDEHDNIFSWPSQQLPYIRARNERGDTSMFGDHFDPIAAIRRLIPGGGRDDGGEAVITDEEIREFIADNVVGRYPDDDDSEHSHDERDDVVEEDNGEEGADQRAVHENAERPGGLRRLYDFFFGTGVVPARPGNIVGEDGEATDTDTDGDEYEDAVSEPERR